MEKREGGREGREVGRGGMYGGEIGREEEKGARRDGGKDGM